MGGRGSFLNVDTGDFTFTEGGQTFKTIARIGNVKVLEKIGQSPVAAPLYSHTENRIYAVVQNKKLKHIAFYDENHKQIRCIDFLHEHNGKRPHAHDNLDHHNDGVDVTDVEYQIADAIVKGGYADDYK